jgi:hypothetical protein
MMTKRIAEAAPIFVRVSNEQQVFLGENVFAEEMCDREATGPALKKERRA